MSLSGWLTFYVKLWCCIDFCWFIALELEWKSLPLPAQAEPVVDRAPGTPDSQLLGLLKVEITLLKKLAPGLDASMMRSSSIPNEHSLSDDAFRAKPFSIRIEKGNFTEPVWVGSEGSFRPRYTFRLLFDKSPYPPREEWKKPEGGPDSNKFWDNVEFVGRRSPELDGKGIAMNDVAPTGWRSCAVC
ncbi:MAG: hypothetical protein M1829_006139 [Trizodia sp. TS-e1964]|nr:MAG: hypothetical protein M1829_006139 [Trizodia sp. TS-e1964]